MGQKSLTPEPASPRTSTRERACSGSWASAASRTAIWSAASLALALPGRSNAASGSPVPAVAVVDESQHRVEPEPALEVRGRVLLLRMRTDQAWRPDPRPPAAGRRRTGDRCAHTRARAAARAARIAAIASSGSPAKASSSRLIVGSEATGPNNSGWARTTATSARQSPPSAIATARSSTVLPGSWTERAARHGANPSRQSFASPLTRAVASSIAAPAEEISDSPPDSTRTPEPAGIVFTYGVPFRSATLDLRQPKFPKQDRHFRALRADSPLTT